MYKVTFTRNTNSLVDRALRAVPKLRVPRPSFAGLRARTAKLLVRAARAVEPGNKVPSTPSITPRNYAMED